MEKCNFSSKGEEKALALNSCHNFKNKYSSLWVTGPGTSSNTINTQAIHLTSKILVMVRIPVCIYQSQCCGAETICFRTSFGFLENFGPGSRAGSDSGSGADSGSDYS
jgi:hypothetical protein